MMLNPPPLIYALTAGMLASINPCGFVMLPGYVFYFLTTEEKKEDGASPEEWAAAVPIGRRLSRGLLTAAVLTAGFMALFLLAGIALSVGVYFLVGAVPYIGLVIGVGLVVLGVLLLAGMHITFGNINLHYIRRRTLSGMFLYGVAYALASLGCTLPVFMVVVGSTFIAGSVAGGISQFVAYAVGMGVVLVAVTLSIAVFQGVLVRRLRRLVRYVERAGAVLLIGVGGYIIYYWLTMGGLLTQG